MSRDHYNVLFLCTGNSARSILAEVLMNHHGGERFTAYSAGSFPKGEVHPGAIRLLARRGFATADLRSKSWDEFAGADAPKMDFIFTVCDNAANEACPIWPGQPVSAHWGVADPAAVEGDEDVVDHAFLRACTELEARIKQFVDLPLERLEPQAVLDAAARIGKSLTVTTA